MKILLTTLNSKYVHMNLALRYLYEAADQFRDEIQLKEFTINNEEDYIYTEILSGEYQLVCFSCYIWNIEKILTLSENLKKAQPNLKIVLGGPEVSFDRENLLRQYGFIDGVIVGEGEVAFQQLCHIFLTEGRIIQNEPAEPLRPEEIPFPYQALAMERDKTVYYESSRGCPYKCSYCLSSTDNCIRALPMDRVLRELDFFLEREVRQVKLIDRTFNWNEERCMAIIRHLMDRDNGITNFHFEMCAEIITEKFLELIKNARPGLMQFEIGIQSTHQDTIKEVQRVSDFEKARHNIKRIMEVGNIHLHLDLIAGLPYEDAKTFRRSFNQVYELGADALQVGFLKLLKGTRIREEAEKHQYQYRSKAPYEVLSNAYMTSLELVAIKKLENVLDMYHNKGGFQNAIKKLINEKDQDPYAFYESFSTYYYKKGHQHKSHKKEDLYRILLGYGEADGYDIHEMREILLLDMKDTLNPEAIKNFERKGFYTL